MLTHITLTAEVEKDFEDAMDTISVKNMLAHPDGHQQLLFTYTFNDLPVAERYYQVEARPTNPYISPRVSLMDKNNVNVEQIIYDYGTYSSSSRQ